MSNWQLEAFGPVGALKSKVECIPITATSTRFDLSARTNIYADLQAGRLVMADADGNDVYYFFSSDNTGTVDDTNTTAANATQCSRFIANVPMEFRLPVYTQAEVNQGLGAATGMCQYLVAKCASGKTATLRLTVVSEAPNKRLG